jgi:protein-disulfide isomerase
MSWVDDRLASLDKGEEIMIEPAKILARLQIREQARRKTQTRLIGAGIFGALACGALATVIAVKQQTRVELPPVPPITIPRTVELPVIVRNEKPIDPPHQVRNTRPESPSVRNFKEMGSPTASVSAEIYIDLECPPCAAFYSQTMPLLISEYVETGKIRLLHRDFPLAQHKYARVAARYADAAGIIGKYDVVSDQIIRTQAQWKDNGDVESQVAAVLSVADLTKLRQVLESSSEPDESIARDRAAGADDHIDQTPSIVLVANGKRRKVAGAISMPLLRNYLDELLAQ